MTQIAIDAYREARLHAMGPAEAAQAAWLAVRLVRRHLRAPDWGCAIARNTSVRRSYRSPLGEVLGLADVSDQGGYCARWPRTLRSQREVQDMRRRVLDYLERAR